MKFRIHLLAASIFLAAFVNGFSQSAQKSSQSDGGVWQRVQQLPAGSVRPRWSAPPGKFQTFALNYAALDLTLTKAPKEFTAQAGQNPTVLTLPMPDGSFARFRIVESPIMEPELAAKFPEIKTYSGQGLDDPTATVRFDVTPEGFHAQVLSPEGTFHVEPYAKDIPDLHASYYLRDASNAGHHFECQTKTADAQASPPAAQPQPLELARLLSQGIGIASVGQMLRIYRLAVAADGEYTTLNGGTVAGAMASITSLINRINGVFEAEFDVRLVLVANNDLVVYVDPATDPYVPVHPCDLGDQNQLVLDTVISTANYDIGHVFSGRSRGGCDGGTACQSGFKGRTTTELSFPHEPLFQMLIVSHELGHQLGASHSWSGTGGICSSGQFIASSAYEPGSGSTIMGYTGLCDSADNLQRLWDPYFHSGSHDEINSYVDGAGASCRVLQPTGNTPPTVSAGSNYIIPARTPFILTATGSDPDGDPVTYCWEQRDLGPQQPATGPGSTDNGSSPLFRSFPATKSPSRTFPKLSDILNNTATIGEQLPTKSRILHFRATVRDNRAGGGGVNSADMQITVVAGAGPFNITSPTTNSIWGGIQTVTWNVAGTTNTPILATNVNILLSTNGGLSFPITLAANTPNDGTESVSLPNLFTKEARIKVEAVGNIFFDVSNPDFIIVPMTPVVVAASASLVAEGCLPTNGVIDPGETVTIQSVFQNIGAADATGLVVTLLPTGGVMAPGAVQTNGLVSANGGRVTNSFSFLADPALPCGGTLVVGFQLQDGAYNLGTVTVPFSLGKTTLAASSFANTNAIVIPVGGGPGIPYPSSIGVAGLPDAVSKVTVTLRRVTHQSPWGVDALLLGPAGQTVMLMSDIPLGPVNNLNFTFDDEAALSLLEVTQLTSGVFRPANAEAYDDEFLPPAPPGPYGSGLSIFNGSNPNGTWKLLVRDTAPEFGGTIAGGWSLAITTSNTVCCSPPDLSLKMTDSPDPVTVGGHLTYTLSVSNVSPAEATGVIVSNALPPGVAFVSSGSSQGACTNINGLVTCSLGTLAAGASATVTLEVTPGAVGTITNTATVTRDGAGANPAANTATVLTTVNPVPGLSIADATVTEINSGAAKLIFLVSLSVVSAQPVAVNYATSDGTAVAGSDYFATNGTVTFNPGETFKTIGVAIPGDTLRESNKTVMVVLSDSANAVIADGLAVGTIIDNDFPVLSVVNVSVAEGNEGTTNANFLVRLSAVSSATVTASYFTFNGTATAGSDYLLTSGSISFLPGTTNQTVAVPVLGDLLNEPNETFQLQLVQATYATLPALAATGTIINDDPLPTLAINDVTVVERNAGTSLAVFSVSLSTASGRNVSVAYATADDTATAGADYVAKSGTLTFPAGTTNLNLAITVNGDVLTETNETFFVNLTSSSLATIADGQGVGTILDDDFKITGATILGSDVRIGFTTVAGRSYRLEHTDNLTTPILWTPVAGGESVAGTGSVVEVLDAVAATQPQRFYRVTTLP